MMRLLKSITTVLALALLVFLLAGCGGGDDEAATTSATQTNTTQANTATAARQAAEEAKPEDLIGQVIVPTENTPSDFTESINNRRPIAVTFYMLGPTDDNRVRSSMSSLENRYKSDMDFYIYLQSDGERYKNLATLLNVNTTPTVVIINSQARVVEAWTGFADEKTLEQGVIEGISY